ncbi:MAG: DMT family transporter [Erysipelotrichaceae bacterium]|jgi:drug/metabolite transporter (DMT)-like permease|nr:DMT family transporter [Erysipelotrichaceae bacterium]
MNRKGIVFIVVSALIYGFIPVVFLWANREGTNAFTLTFLKSLVSLPLLYLILKIRRVSLRLERQNLWHILFLSGFMLITNLLLSISYLYIDIGTATNTHFFYPIFVLLLSSLLFKVRIQLRQILSILIGIAGILCFFSNFSADTKLGFLLAIASGFTYALYLVFIEQFRLGKKDGFVLSFYMSAFSCLLSLPLSLLPFDQTSFTFLFTPMVLLYVLLLSVLTNLIAIVLLNTGVSLLGSTTVSLLSLAEPVSAYLFGIWLLNQSMSIREFAGCGLIILSLMVLILKRTNPSEKKEN